MITLALWLSNAAVNSQETFPAYLSGPQKSLEQLIVAARHCGYTNAKITYGSNNARYVAIDMPVDPGTKGPASYTVEWFLKHPDLSFTFLGNAAR